MKTTDPIPTHALSDLDPIGIKIEKITHRNGYDPSDIHRHDYFEIFLFRTGGGHHLIDFCQYPIKNGSLHFIMPGQIHQIARTGSAIGYVLLFSESFYYYHRKERDFLSRLPYFYMNGGAPVLEVSEHDFEKLERNVSVMQEEFISPNRLRRDILRSHLNILLCKCEQLFEANRNRPDGAGIASPESARFYQFKMELENRFRECKTVAEYAACLAITPRRLNDLCKQYGDANAQKFIHSRILLEAKRLLAFSELNINQIAADLGFDDAAHFSRFFRQLEGMPPLAWRADSTNWQKKRTN